MPLTNHLNYAYWDWHAPYTSDKIADHIYLNNRGINIAGFSVKKFNALFFQNFTKSIFEI